MTTATGYSARNESIKLSILLTCLCLSILYGDWLWRWDRLIYDAQSSLIKHQADNDIVIIAIDETSLQSLGRWPWSRNIHASLIEKLSQHQARAIIIDVIFSESTTDIESDRQLAEAIKKNGKVVLPVLLEQTRVRGHLLETLPLPALTQAAADIGHVHVELDPDGIARGTYLYEGLGEARWSHIGLSTLRLLNEVDETIFQNIKTADNAATSPWTWVRKHHFLIPYIGPPGSFQTTSYINILSDQVSPGSLKDKIVLVGVTAAGLGDSLPTPVSGLTRAMPGIEINANIVQAIRSNTMIKEVNPVLHYVIASLLVMLPILIFPYLSPRMTLILVISEIAIIFLASLVFIHWLHIWMPVSATLICLLLAYPLWAWRRLEFTVKYLNTELETLSREAGEIEQYVAQDSDLPFESLQKLVPVEGISVFEMNNEMILSLGNFHSQCPEKLSESRWLSIMDHIFAQNIFINNGLFKVCINWNEATPPNDQQSKILKIYIRQSVKPNITLAKTTVEIIESRIRDIQTTTDKLIYLRQFITDSLEQMADSVIVVDSLGIVSLANRQAIMQFESSTDVPLLHNPIQPLLNTLTITTGESWDTIINSLLSYKHYENLQIRTNKNKDLVANISPLYKANGTIVGFIINLSDITEIKDAQRKRNEMLSFLSHDLRSPLVSILAMLEQNKSIDYAQEQTVELNKRIEKNIHHTIQLAEDFVHLSRVESDEEISLSTVNLSDVIANAVDTVWDQASIKKIQIKQQLNIDGWVQGNGAILERVIINLLTNAIKYSDEECLIFVKLDKLKTNIVCCIQDNGPGINEDEVPYLFDRFKRAQQINKKPVSNSQGIGLGLAFAHAAIERHHGTISVNSVVGEGTEFCILLPEEIE